MYSVCFLEAIVESRIILEYSISLKRGPTRPNVVVTMAVHGPYDPWAMYVSSDPWAFNGPSDPWAFNGPSDPWAFYVS